MVDEGDAVVTAPPDPADGAGQVPEVPGYELGALLARGGTSEVWAGVALDGGRRVAVKVVHAALAPVEAAAREAAVSARAADAQLVTVEACVPLPDGRVAVVMPHLLGGAVDALVRARGHLSPGEVVTVLAPMAAALGRLHDLGVVHGDVSPGNVLLDLDGRPVLGDLGLGQVVGEVSPGVWGTDGYVAPEVLLGGDPTAASDVYALGAVGWLCLSGAVPGPPGLRPELAQVCLAGEGSEPVVAALVAAVAAEPDERPGAHELAWLLFTAAEPEPLRLVHGDDEVSAVTYRLRAAAGRPPTASPARRWRRCRPRMPRTRQPPRYAARAGATSPGRHAGTDLRRGWGVRDLRAGRRVVAGSAAMVLVLVALLVLMVAVLGRPERTAAARPTAGAESAVRTTDPTTEPTTKPTADPTTDPTTDPQAPRTRPAQLLGALVDGRAAAWREATPALLLAADAAGSAAAARDAADVAEVARAGVRYTGFHYSVAHAAVVSATAQHAVLRARVDAGPYAVTGASGRTSRPAVAGEPVLVDLVFTDAGWRVSDVRPAR